MADHLYTHHSFSSTTPFLFSRALVSLLAFAKRLALPALCFSGLALRLYMLSAYPFREDEAMYSVWARHLWQVDPQALALWPDKPPLFLWLLGGVFQLFGSSESAARLLNIAADTLTIGVVAAVGRVLWRQRAGVFAALAYTLSPFAISFAPTAYTDPTLVLWGTLALYAALTRRSFWAGFFLAAAIATKQQGLFYGPLIVGVLLLDVKALKGKNQKKQVEVSTNQPKHLSITSLFLGFALLALPVLLWDASRWSVAPSPWDLSVRNYAPLILLSPEVWVARAVEWGQVAWNLAGNWWVIGFWVAGIGYWAVTTRRQIAVFQHPTTILALWFFGFAGIHIITSVQIWDRYLLPLVPVLALFAGWIATQLIRQAEALRKTTRHHHFLSLGASRVHEVLLVAGFFLLLPPALTAARGGLPIGADHGDYTGLLESIAWLRANAPADAVVYHRDVGWQLRFAFFAGSPAQPDASNFALRWFPNAVYLADNGAKTPERRKFLIEPVWASVGSATQRLQQRGIGLKKRLRVANFTLYELITLPTAPCDWCLCLDRAKQQSSHGFLTYSPVLPYTASGVQP